MKKLINFCLVGLFFFVGASHCLAQKKTKKIDRLLQKQVSKYWKDQAITQTLIDTKQEVDFNLFFKGNELYRLDDVESTVGFLLLRRGFGCKIGGCGAVGGQGAGQICTSDGNAYEYFDYTILLDTNLTVLKIAVVNYPGDYGYEITSKGWLKQFKGYNGARLQYGREIDAISGATISANSITMDIVMVHDMLSKLILEKSIIAMK